MKHHVDRMRHLYAARRVVYIVVLQLGYPVVHLFVVAKAASWILQRDGPGELARLVVLYVRRRREGIVADEIDIAGWDWHGRNSPWVCLGRCRCHPRIWMQH